MTIDTVLGISRPQAARLNNPGWQKFSSEASAGKRYNNDLDQKPDNEITAEAMLRYRAEQACAITDRATRSRQLNRLAMSLCRQVGQEKFLESERVSSRPFNTNHAKKLVEGLEILGTRPDISFKNALGEETLKSLGSELLAKLAQSQQMTAASQALRRHTRIGDESYGKREVISDAEKRLLRLYDINPRTVTTQV